jgi:hypothetical protein
MPIAFYFFLVEGSSFLPAFTLSPLFKDLEIKERSITASGFQAIMLRYN